MKKIFNIALFFMAIALTGCSNEDVILQGEVSTGSDSLYTVSFGTADFDLLNETRASGSNTIYGINIEYYKNGTRQGYYAYGLFDDMSNASITLIGGYTYNFTCSIVRIPESGHKLWYGPYSKNSFSGYADPFQLNSSVSTQCLNKFVEGTTSYLSGLGTGTSVCVDNSTAGYGAKKFPKLERYYGKLEGFNPATDGTHVVIPVNKAYFGCKLILKGVKDGTLSTSSSNTDMYFLTSSTTTEDKVTEERIYTFQDVASCWTNPSYSLSTTLKYTYTSNRQKENGSPTLWNLSGSKSITFKRNVMTTITVSVTEDLSGASVGVSLEEMGPDNEIEFRVDDDYNLYQVDN